MKKIRFVGIVAVLLALVMGCALPGGGGGGAPASAAGSVGTLALSFRQAGMNAIRTFLPPTDMSIASYDVQGSGPSGATFEQLGITGPSLTVGSLVTGDWLVAVDAKNGAGERIATGSTAATIVGGQTTPATAVVTPVSGVGTLAFTIAWPAASITSPSVTVLLTPQGGAPVEVPVTMAGDNLSASFTDPAQASGYHVLMVTLKDGAQVAYGLTDVVRIIAGSTTTANISLTAEDLQTTSGALDLTITPDLNDPVTITFSGQQAALAMGTTMTVSAATSVPVDSYQWYLNGALLVGEVSSSVTVGSALETGNYRLDVVVSKLNVMSAEHISFKVASLVATPTFSIPGGTYATDQSVSLSCATAGATILYTTDGSTPTSASLVYSAPILVSGNGTSMTISAMATKAGMVDSAVASQTYTISNVAFSQPPDAAGGLIVSSQVTGTGSDFDAYAYDDFTLSVDTAIREVRWRGGYGAGGISFGAVTNFTVTFYASAAGDTQPLCDNPHLGDNTFLANYSVGGNAGETEVGVFGGTTMYDYSFVLPTAFQATAGVKYWLKIEAAQDVLPNWGRSVGTGGDNSHYRFLNGSGQFSTVPQDTAVTFLL